MKKKEVIVLLLKEVSKKNSFLSYRNVLSDDPNYMSMLECQYLKLYDFTDE